MYNIIKKGGVLINLSERDNMIDLLRRFSQEGCNEGGNINNCENCELNKRGLCQIVNLMSECLNDEITESRMIQEMLFDYTARKFNE